MADRTCSVEGCAKPTRSRGMCAAHYQRAWASGVLDMTRPSVTERFWAKVEKTETCWLWTGTISTEGYGTLRVNRKHVYAHRVSYELHIGPIPAGLHIDHVLARGCRFRHCVNPDHLEPVTRVENVRRSPKFPRTHCRRGHPFDLENTYVNRAGSRKCRTCVRERKKR